CARWGLRLFDYW
nr:immunoglobulin heavy chain junction region [Mus musculus]